MWGEGLDGHRRKVGIWHEDFGGWRKEIPDQRFMVPVLVQEGSWGGLLRPGRTGRGVISAAEAWEGRFRI